MLGIDEQGWAYADAPGDPELLILPSPRHSPLDVPAPVGPVWHTTDVVTDTRHLASRIVKAPTPEKRSVSWHFLIGRDGLIVHQIPCNRGAWHVGKLKGAGPVTMGGAQLPGRVNRATVGIELMNAGRLSSVAGRLRCPDDPAVVIPFTNAKQLADRWYHDFPAIQVAAAEALLLALVERYGWAREVCGYGHVSFDPANGKEDPHALWMSEVLPGILARVFPPRVA